MDSLVENFCPKCAAQKIQYFHYKPSKIIIVTHSLTRDHLPPPPSFEPFFWPLAETEGPRQLEKAPDRAG